MKVIVTLDDKNGMMFNKRRQSRDIVLLKHMLDMVGEHKLFMNSYTAKQFLELPCDNIIVDENFLEVAGEEDFCFVEDQRLVAYREKISHIYIYKWNRLYPSDFKFEVDLTGWKGEVLVEFEGHSHDKITLEEWTDERG